MRRGTWQLRWRVPYPIRAPWQIRCGAFPTRVPIPGARASLTRAGPWGGSEGERRRQRAEVPVSLLSLIEDRLCDRDCKVRVIARFCDRRRLARVAQVAALDEHARKVRIPREPQSAPYQAAAGLLAGRRFPEVFLDAFRKRVAVHPPEKHLRSGNARRPRVEMDAHEDSIAERVHEVHAPIEFTCDVAVAGQDASHALGQFRLDEFYHREREVFLVLPGSRALGAAVRSPMARIEDDGGKSARPGTMPPLVTGDTDFPRRLGICSRGGRQGEAPDDRPQ